MHSSGTLNVQARVLQTWYSYVTVFIPGIWGGFPPPPNFPPNGCQIVSRINAACVTYTISHTQPDGRHCLAVLVTRWLLHST